MARARVTWSILAANVLAFVLVVIAGGSPFDISSATLIQIGGNFAPLVTGGQWWRLLVNVFLHASLLHIGFNMLALWQAGPLVERLFGSLPFALIYLGAGLGGSVASIFWRQEVVSVGASGAVFGIYGALLAYLAGQRGAFSLSSLRSLRVSALAFIIYSLAFGFGTTGIDNAAHLGGLAGGILLGAAFARPLEKRSWQAREVVRAAILSAPAVVLFGGLLVATPDKSEVYRRGLALETMIDAFGDEEREINNVVRDLQERLKNRTLTDDEAVVTIERELIPRWDKRIAALSSPALAGTKNEQLRQTLVQYATLRRDSMALLSTAIRTDDRSQADEAKRKYEAATRLLESFHDKPTRLPGR